MNKTLKKWVVLFYFIGVRESRDYRKMKNSGAYILLLSGPKWAILLGN